MSYEQVQGLKASEDKLEMQEQRSTRGNEKDAEKLEIKMDRRVMRRAREEEREYEDNRGGPDDIFWTELGLWKKHCKWFRARDLEKSCEYV